MSDFTEDEKKWLKENFKVGEYSEIIILVKHTELEKFMDTLKSSGLNLAVMPKLKEGAEKGTIQ